MARAVRQSRPTPSIPPSLRPGRSRVRRRRLLATYDRLPIEAQGVLLRIAGDLWRAARRRAAAAHTARVADAPTPRVDADRELLLATIRRAHAHARRDAREDRA